jgi:hypothetical protein
MSLTRASAAVIKTEELVNNRNLIINGAMQVVQRGTSVTGITTSNYYTADRWVISLSSVGTWTMNVDSSGPTNTEFRNSANLICTTADSSLSASDIFLFHQRLEGQNLQGVKKGTSAAESLTVSFWVKSSNTGTYICEFFDNDNTRQISKSYTINTANTWEKKTITVPPDTTGQFDNDNATSLFLFFCLAAGSDRTSGTLNDSTWASNVNANRNVGQLNLANAVGNYWAVTGIQLEKGSTATPYEWRNYGTELALCQRYFYSMGGSSTYEQFGFISSTGATDGRCVVYLPVSMRTKPSIIQTGAFQIAGGLTSLTGTHSAGTTMYADSVGFFSGNQNIGFDFWPGTAGSYGVTNAGSFVFRANDSTATRFQFSAEL